VEVLVESSVHDAQPIGPAHYRCQSPELPRASDHVDLCTLEFGHRALELINHRRQ
jgi:hypothetical protein